MKNGSRLLEYLYWLSFSKEFKEKQRKILDNYFKGVGDPKEGPKMLERLIKHYEMADKPQPMQNIFTKFIFDKSEEILRPIEAQRIDMGMRTKVKVIKGPALVITIRKKFTRKDLEKLWKMIEAGQTGKAYKTINPVFKELFKEKSRLTKKTNFDRDFRWYKAHKEGKTFRKILQEEENRQGLSEETVSKGEKTIRDILDNL